MSEIRKSFCDNDGEYDIYFDTKKLYPDEDHRLTLRRKNDNYEVYRFYYYDKSEKVVFSGILSEAVDVINRENTKYRGISGNQFFTEE